MFFEVLVLRDLDADNLSNQAGSIMILCFVAKPVASQPTSYLPMSSTLISGHFDHSAQRRQLWGAIFEQSPKQMVAASLASVVSCWLVKEGAHYHRSFKDLANA